MRRGLRFLEDDQLAEIYYERENEYTLAGSIYNGRVTRVLPGMQSAFVDLGLERDAFLYVTDFIELEDQEETDELEKAAATGQAPREIRHPHSCPRHSSNVNRNGGRREDRGGRGPATESRSPRQDRRTPEEAPAEMAAPEATECCRSRKRRRRSRKKRAEAAGADGVAAAADAEQGARR